MPVATKKKTTSKRRRGAATGHGPVNGSRKSASVKTEPAEKVLTPRARVRTLSPAEREVVEALARGLSPKEVATERGTSIATVRTQIKKAKKKSSARTLNELVALVCLAPKRS